MPLLDAPGSARRNGLCLLLGDCEPLTALLKSSQDSLPPSGPLGCLAITSPKDRQREYVVRSARNAAAFNHLALPIVQKHLTVNGTERPVIMIAVSAADPLRAYLDAKAWLQLVETGLAKTLKEAADFAASFEPAADAPPTVLGYLGFTQCIVITGSAAPEPALALALRRLAKNANIHALLAVQQDDVSHPNLHRLRNLMTGGDENCGNTLLPEARLYVQPSQDTSIDEQLPSATEPVTLLSSRPQKAEESVATATPPEEIESAVGLEACLLRISQRQKRPITAAV